MSSTLAAHLDTLAADYRAGNDDAFDAIIALTESELRLFLMSRTRMMGEVEEAIQATYVAAFEHIATYEARGTLLSWLKGIGRNRLHELWRQRQRGDPLDASLDALLSAETETTDEDGQLRILGRLRTCLDRLDQRSRDLLEHHHVDGVALNELAQRYHRPRAAIAKLLFGLRERMRQCVEQSLREEGAPHV